MKPIDQRDRSAPEVRAQDEIAAIIAAAAIDPELRRADALDMARRLIAALRQ